tara:strand:+ start:5354 stop:5680 length:327 start_codon:yes stop_codon:yes gene_type:complete
LVRGYEKLEIITQEEAEVLLSKGVKSAERAVLKLIKVPLSDGQFDVLVSFTYNLGPEALQCSTLRRKVNRQAHGEVPDQLMRWVWAGCRKMKGLFRRREAEAYLYFYD